MTRTATINGERINLTADRAIRSAYWRFRRSDMDTLMDAYDRPSTAKARAEHNILLMMQNELDAEMGSYRIIGHSAQQFSCGFLLQDDNGQELFCWVTASKMRFMALADYEQA